MSFAMTASCAGEKPPLSLFTGIAECPIIILLRPPVIIEKVKGHQAFLLQGG